MVESLLFLGAGAGVGVSEKKYLEPEPVKNGLAPQHWLYYNRSVDFQDIVVKGNCPAEILAATNPIFDFYWLLICLFFVVVGG